MTTATSPLPKLTSEQRRAASGQFERANQVLNGGDHDYGLQLLLECCKIDPSNLIYRQTLRQTQRSSMRTTERPDARLPAFHANAVVAEKIDVAAISALPS